MLLSNLDQRDQPLAKMPWDRCLPSCFRPRVVSEKVILVTCPPPRYPDDFLDRAIPLTIPRTGASE